MPVDGQFPVGEQILLVNLDPCHNQLVLLWRRTAGQQPAIADRIDPNLSLVFCVDMRFVMTTIVMEEHLDLNAKEDGNGGHCLVLLNNLALAEFRSSTESDRS
ncbi:MAG: hypothetical protein MUF25_13995 [Pirellulaceae bacterium]|jgi:hypothetical protein|nr:hypothetical protein [Pirellulaceae bacterium]